MVDARVKAAHGAWVHLLGVLAQRGWRDRSTRLILFDTFVKTCLLYRCGLWGGFVLPASGRLVFEKDREPLAVFYRRCLRSLLGVQ